MEKLAISWKDFAQVGLQLELTFRIRLWSQPAHNALNLLWNVNVRP